MNFNVRLHLHGKKEMTRMVLVQPRKLGKNDDLWKHLMILKRLFSGDTSLVNRLK